MTASRRHVDLLLAAGLLAVAVAVRFAQHHAALLYPDGYQYLLMARGISEHLRVTTALGPGGATFVPNPDAAAKPLFPLVVAAAHAVGLSWLTSARVVTAGAAGAAVALTALLTCRLTGSRIAAAAAALLLLVSPSAAFWSGFSGPDPLAQALALGSALAFLNRRPRLGGILLGLAVAARPELLVLALLAAIVALGRSPARRDVGRAAVAATTVLAVVFALTRPPIALPDLRLLLLAVVLLCLGGLCVAALRTPFLVVVAAVASLSVVALGTAAAPGAARLWHDDWPLLGLALGGLALAARGEERRARAAAILSAAAALGVVYWMKNPGLERYFSLLLPLAALLVGVGIAALPPRRWVAASGLAFAVGASLLVSPIPGNRDADAFSAAATKLSPYLSRSSPLVTAAPDAYSFWLPDQRVEAMRVGARGAVLLDSAQRAFAPELGASGRVVSRFGVDSAFVRPDGQIDPGSAEIVAGRVVLRRALRSR